MRPKATGGSSTVRSRQSAPTQKPAKATATTKATRKAPPQPTTFETRKRATVSLDARPATQAPQSFAGAERLFSSVGVEVKATRRRPPDVVAAKDAFDPSIYTKQQRAWAGLIAEAMEQLGGPRILVNRPADSALRLLERGGRFTTAFDRKDVNDAYLDTRRVHEERLGTHGVGDDAGKTVYGSVEFAAVRADEPVDGAVIKAAKRNKPLPRTELNSGIELTDGAVTFVMKNELAQHSTFLPGDTYLTWATPPRAVEHLAYAVLENILKEGDMYFESFSSDEMFELPRKQAVAALKEYLSSEALDRSYLESQSRAATLDDVAYVIIRDDDDTRRSPGATRPLADVLADVKAKATARGLPVLDERELS